MVYAYVRVSSDKQTTENQQFEIYKFIEKRNILIDQWVEETTSSTRQLKDRKLGSLIDTLQQSDVLICTELSRLGRSLMEVMSILHHLMGKEVMVYSIKEGYELGNNIGSKVLAFAFGLSAEIERNMIAQRTKEALARKKAEGKNLGRPKGSLSKSTKLTGREVEIQHLLKSGVSLSAIGRMMKVNRVTVSNYVKSRNLRETSKKRIN